MTELKLKPCPFCGGPGEEWEEEGGYPWLFIKVVGCRKCHVSFYNDNGDEGVTKWNRRIENGSGSEQLRRG